MPCPPPHGHTGGPLSRGSPENGRSRPASAAQCGRCSLIAGSPEQIAHGLRQRYPEDPTMRVSHEALYTYSVGAAPGGFHTRTRSRPAPAPPLASAPQGPALVAPRPGQWAHRRTAGRGRRSAGAGPVGGRLARRPCHRVGTGDAGGTDHPVDAAGVPWTAKDAPAGRQACAREGRPRPAPLRRSLPDAQG